MEIWPRRRTDAVYVEMIRKQLRMARWARYFIAAIWLVVLAMAIWAVWAFVAFLINPAQQFAFAASIAMGIMVGVSIGNAVHNVGVMFSGFRQEKLLIDCWDALEQLLAERNEALNSPGAGVDAGLDTSIGSLT